MIVSVIGGGPAGMMAAAEAARLGHTVTIYEKNEKLGKKLYITGKGRCNVTNDCDRDGFFTAVKRNPRFLYSAFSAFDNRDIQALIEAQGCPLKTERGGRVFPVSDKSVDILRAMERVVYSAGARVCLEADVEALLTERDRVTGLRFRDGTTVPTDCVILATGGISYPSTGSTGDGYRFAERLGHTVIHPVGSLVPLITEQTWPAELTGLSLKNVTLTARKEGKVLYRSEPGEMLFTHFGVSGPLVLSLSALIAGEEAGTGLAIDLKPGLTPEQLDARLLRDIAENRAKLLPGAFHALLPERLLKVVLNEARADTSLIAGDLKKADRLRLRDTLKALPLTVTGPRPVDEAIVTRGGVSVKNIDAKTMRSKRVKGLSFAGEIIDVDAVTGGYNLQIAWSTGALAGRCVCND